MVIETILQPVLHIHGIIVEVVLIRMVHETVVVKLPVFLTMK